MSLRRKQKIEEKIKGKEFYVDYDSHGTKGHDQLDFPKDSPPPKKSSLSPITLELKKKYYGIKEALEVLDEEFNFFNIKTYSIQQFFDLYNRLFYDIETDTHKDFMQRSIKYAFPDGYENFKNIEIKDLREQLKDLQKEIDSTEREHFYFRNGSFLMDKIYLESSNGTISRGGNVYYMQSGKRREITEFKVYSNIKQRLRKQKEDIDDKEFIAFIDTSSLNSIPLGPPINQASDIYISDFEINIYPQTVEEYEPDFEEETNPNDEYLNVRN